MTDRRRARRTALELLYQAEIREISAEEVIDDRRELARQTVPDYTRTLVVGVHAHLAEIDGMIDRYAEHWNIDRMPVIDRNVMRMSVYEMIYQDDVPIGAAINEAVEIAKAYGTDDSGKFVNGLLARIALEVRGKAREEREEREEVR